MSFFNPLAFIGLLSVPAIIAMYLLKQKYKEYKVSSLFLWKEALALSQAQRPWQRLRRNLLMALQLAAAVVLTLALAEPHIAGGARAERYIIVMDTSMSMKAEDERPNRFEAAREQALRLVDSLSPGSEAAVIAAGSEPYIVSGFTGDKAALAGNLNGLSPTNASAESGVVESLVNMLREQTDATAYVFTDGGLRPELENLRYLPVGGPLDNTAVTLMSHSADADRIISLVRVKNYGREAVSDSVSLYADDRIIDVKAFELPPGGESDIFFTSVPGGARYLKAVLSEGDGFTHDDTGYDTVAETQERRVLLVTENNLFLENMLSILPGLEVYKAGSTEGLDTSAGLSGYYLYVFDGVLPETVPSDGHLLILNPPEGNSFIPTEADFETGGGYTKDDSLLRFISELNFSVSRAKRMTAPAWARTVMSSEGLPVIFAGEEAGRKVLVMGFDLHNTDLPLRKEFPIFMYNLAQWFIPSGVTAAEGIRSGDAVEFNLPPDAARAAAVSPGGAVTQLAPPFPAEPFGGTDEPGFYTLELYDENEERSFASFAVNVSDAESDLSLGSGVPTDSVDGAEAGGIEFNRNLTDVFLVILLIILAFEYAVYLRQSRPSYRIFTAAVRGALTLLIILTLIGVDIRRGTDRTVTVLAYDLSASMGGTAERIASAVNTALQTKPAEDLAGAVCFGENAVIDAAPSENYFFPSVSSVVGNGFTNIADGLRLASTILPEDARNRVTLFSDGRENLGDALAQARILKSRGIILDAVHVSNLIDVETQLTSVNVPKTLNKGVSYDAEVIVHSLADNTARLLLYQNNRLVTSEAITVRPGENRYVFTDAPEAGGGIVYRAEIQPAADTFYENNAAYAYSYAEDGPNILVADYEGSSGEIMKILEGAEVNAAAMSSETLPAALERLNIYDALILPDVPVEAMPEGMPELIESYVRDAGGGLLATGGENAYALGGYASTPLETALPVDMRLRNKENEPNLGMVIVTDRSGSMSSGRYGVSKLELAKESAIRAADALGDEDYLGVLAFDDGNNIWASEYRRVQGEKENIKNEIARINLGGGTSILPALSEAFEVIAQSDAKLRHIILLTDGQAESTGYDGLIAAMRSNAVTLTTVAVGSDADLELLERLAGLGGGRYYYTDEFTDLPKIFAKETVLAGKDHLRNITFFPEAQGYHAILSGLTALPSLDGYVALTKKTRADGVLTGPDGDPILAAWQYGLGRSAAWASDMNGSWSAAWLASDEGNDLFRNMLSWVIRKPLGSEASISARIAGDESEISLSIPYSDGIRGVTGTLAASGADARYGVEFRAVAPGEYTATVPEGMAGAYIASITLDKIGGAESLVTGFSVPYPPEYDLRLFSGGNGLLERITAETGGRVLSDPAEIFAPLAAAAFGEYDLGGALLTAALIWLLLDIALRRFPAVTQLAAQKTRAAASAVRRAVTVGGALAGKKSAPVFTSKNEADGPALPSLGGAAAKASGGGKISERATDENGRTVTAADTSSLLRSAKKKRTGGP